MPSPDPDPGPPVSPYFGDEYNFADPSSQIDWFGMSSPYFNRGIPWQRMGDTEAINQQWMQTYQLGQMMGLGGDFSSWMSNTLTPKAIDNALKHDNPTHSEQIDYEMGGAPIMLPIPGMHFKLKMGSSNDRFEKEADEVSEKVMRMTEPALQPKCKECEEEEKAQAKPLILAKSNPDSGETEVKPWIASRINQSKGQGNALPENTRSFMENRMGADLSKVRIHHSSPAVQMNKELNARAFTVGSDIFFNEGEYQPGSYEGKKLLAHELAHTMQQGATLESNTAQPSLQRKEIDYKQLSWADFEGAAPRGSSNEAFTSSNLKDPELDKIKPKETSFSEIGSCEGDKPRFKAKIEYDPDRFVVKATFNTTTSWKQSWTADKDVQEARCKSKLVNPCNSAMTKSSKEGAVAQVKACKEAAAELKDKEYLTFECGGKQVKVTKAAECDPLKECFEKALLKTGTWEYKAHTGATVSATGKDDCDDKVLKECKTSLMPALSADLLSHEQGHLDITQRLAEQIQKDLREKAKEMTTEAEGCSKEEAEANARKALKAKKPLQSFKKIWQDGKKKLKTVQTTYDSKTQHSVEHDVQQDWNVKIAKGEFDEDE